MFRENHKWFKIHSILISFNWRPKVRRHRCREKWKRKFLCFAVNVIFSTTNSLSSLFWRFWIWQKEVYLNLFRQLIVVREINQINHNSKKNCSVKRKRTKKKWVVQRSDDWWLSTNSFFTTLQTGSLQVPLIRYVSMFMLHTTKSKSPK